MPTIADIRQQAGGAYDDLSDQQLADAIYRKHYSDLPREEFNSKIGFTPAQTTPAAKPYSAGPISALPELGARGINALAQMLPESVRPAARAPQPLQPLNLPLIGQPSAIEMGKGLVKEATSAATLPGDVYAGRVDPESEEGIRRAGGMAMLAALPSAGRSLAKPAPVKIVPQEVNDAAATGFKAAENMGVEMSPEYIRSQLQDIRTGLGNINPERASGTFGELARREAQLAAPEADAMAALTGTKPAARAPVTFQDIQGIRQGFGDIAGDFAGATNTDRMAAVTAKRGIDAILENAPPSAAIKGDIGALSQTLREANANYAGQSRQETIGNIIERATQRASSGGSGQNVENVLRQEFRTFIRKNNDGISPAMKEGFNAAEINAIDEFVRTGSGNFRRWLGNALGGGGGLGASVVGGVATHVLGPLGFALPAAGAAIKHGSGTMAEQLAARLEQMAAERSPYAQQLRASQLPMTQMGQLPSPLPAGLPLLPSLPERQPLRITVRPRAM